MQYPIDGFNSFYGGNQRRQKKTYIQKQQLDLKRFKTPIELFARGSELLLSTVLVLNT
jgi:hypothetical protein